MNATTRCFTFNSLMIANLNVESSPITTYFLTFGFNCRTGIIAAIAIDVDNYNFMLWRKIISFTSGRSELSKRNS